MTYNTIAAIAHDDGLRKRLIACAAEQNAEWPVAFIDRYVWRLAATPGWAAKWESALANETIPDDEIGINGGVVTDSDILAAVQPLALQSTDTPV